MSAHVNCVTYIHLASFASLQVKEMMFKRSDYLDEVPKMPDFVVALRPHTVWEKTPVKLFCTVQGNPRPIVKWSEHSHPSVSYIYISLFFLSL